LDKIKAFRLDPRALERYAKVDLGEHLITPLKIGAEVKKL